MGFKEGTMSQMKNLEDLLSKLSRTKGLGFEAQV
jgi:hypothetical protein